MSYEIVKSINEKEKTIISASNNIRPLLYEKVYYNKDISTDDFRAYVIINILWGNYHLSNKNHKYNCIAEQVKKTPEYNELYEAIWNFNDTYTEEYRKENYNKNQKLLRELVLKVFNEYKKDNNKYVISCGYAYVIRVNK